MVFDVDGVLTQTAKLHAEAWKEMFDAFLDEFDLHDPVIDQVANIVRAADTGQLGQAREAPGLLAISLGMSVNVADDILLLEQAMPVYDALYAWRKRASHETHGWPQPPS